jgi:hypothetical protein
VKFKLEKEFFDILVDKLTRQLEIEDLSKMLLKILGRK